MKSYLIALPNPNLRKRSRKVGVITDRVKKIVQQMQATTLEWERSRDHEVGVALAAVQIDKLLRIVVIRNDFNNKEDHSFSVFIDPEITKYEGDVEADFEGCLSVKDIYGKVPRYSKVRIKAVDLEGRVFRVTAEGFLARVFQHEIDHTKGIVFIDHIRDDKNAFFRLMPDGELSKLDYDKDIKDDDLLWQ